MNKKRENRVGQEIEENLQFPSPLTPPIMPFGNGRFNPNSDIVCCLFSFPHPCRLSYISYVLHQGYALICNWCRTPARNIHSIRQIGLFGPSLFLGTMALLTPHTSIFQVLPCMRSHGISQCSFLVYPCDLRHGVTFVFWALLLLANLPVQSALVSHFCSQGYDFAITSYHAPSPVHAL